MLATSVIPNLVGRFRLDFEKSGCSKFRACSWLVGCLERKLRCQDRIDAIGLAEYCLARLPGWPLDEARRTIDRCDHLYLRGVQGSMSRTDLNLDKIIRPTFARLYFIIPAGRQRSAGDDKRERCSKSHISHALASHARRMCHAFVGQSLASRAIGVASRTVGLLGGIFTYARDELGIIEVNPAHGVRKPKDAVRTRRLNEDEYRILGRILSKAAEDERYTRTTEIIRLIAMSGCRRGEIIEAKKVEIDTVGSAFRFEDTKEGQSVRPMGLPIVEYFDERGMDGESPYVFPGERSPDGPFGSFPRHWEKIFAETELADITAHVLRHSFASMANDLGFTEITIAALLGHATGSVTSRYIHTLDAALIMAADTVSGYIRALLDGSELFHTHYALDQTSRKAALARFLTPHRAETAQVEFPQQAAV